MIDAILAKRNASTKACITVKTLISLAVIAMAVAFPQIVHMATGAAGGVKWLPMYLPVIIGACVLGAKWGVEHCRNSRIACNRQSILYAARRNFPKHNALFARSHHGADNNRYSGTYRKSRNRSYCRKSVLACA